ncbi:GNAT family N-acetyltransferase [Paenibacillus selenitireducens]|uniref:GNAT family N-acetyltransferase n=1 Tax=Paenibacillus selenitireducens TaxID=1324314 RepID=A0A1T2X1M4_9BACL|nr:GNAT family N-acetyltransferase [Paenibacillus selenitireducens]OPA73770.1 GNAT family N-acetyltransferase [Paenibacillus selenitireducens]
MQIRTLDSHDAALYRNLRLQGLQAHPEAFSSSYEEEQAYTLDHFESRLRNPDLYTYGAFFNGQLVGVVTLILEKKIKLKHRTNIVAMYVDMEQRRQGIGKMLMLQAINKAKTMDGIERIYLSVISNNEPAQKLYHSLGFETYGRDRNALKIGGSYVDDELMVLFI